MKTVNANIGENRYEWTFNDDGSVWCNGSVTEIEMRPISLHRVSVLERGSSFDAVVYENDTAYDVLINGKLLKVSVESPKKKTTLSQHGSASAKNAEAEVRSPMPGMVVRCEVKEGEKINAGDGLFVLEAMKMENEIRATVGGTVKKVLVAEKQIVDKGELLLIIN